MDFKSSPFMYAVGIIIVLFVLAQSVFFLVRAVKRGKELGISSEKMKNTALQSALFSIAPALSIVATVIVLSGALGVVLPWIRLTVIGAIQYETSSAQSALNAMGNAAGISAAITDPEQFTTVAWVMTVGSVMPLVILPFVLKKLQKGIGKAMGKNKVWADIMSAAAFIGIIIAFVGRAILGTGDKSLSTIGDGAGVLSVTGLLSSVGFMLLFSFLVKKFPKLKKIESFAMPLSMFLGMGMVLLVNYVFPAQYLIEWRY
ncbi:MAG: DUF5058 family protein [Clostridia bacterium]|nr:DUF5058 family protein [Clostridia bacterium]